MSAGANAMTMQSQPRATADIPLSRRIYWAVRREFWESRAIYLAPVAGAAMFLVGFVLHSVHVPGEVRAAMALDPAKQQHALAQPYELAGDLMMGVFLLVALFYCVESMQRERRDRSILFWKSLPVSDVITVGAKASIPLFFLPLISVGVATLLQFAMALVSSVALAASGMSVGRYWSDLSLGQMCVLLAYHVFTAHVLWGAPIYGWLMLVSAWARRAALLWAFMPPLAIVIMEKLLFNSAHFASYLEWRFWGGSTDAASTYGTMPMSPMVHLTPLTFISTPGLWVGFAVTAVFLATAVRLRRNQEPM
jgi:ABC-2 type transport system permease protein